MKRAFMVVFILLISFAFAPGGFTVSKQALIKPQTQLGTETKLKMSGFVGTVIMIDANLIQVKGKKGEVTFDASNPALTGYKDISDVVVGDTVAVQYTKDGILIKKFKGKSGEKKAEKVKKAYSKKDPVKAQTPIKTAAKQKIAGFVGTVTMVYSNLIDVLGKTGEVVTFDASNPALTGYKDISDVVVGDTVAVQYTKDGILITKLKETAKRIVFGEKKTNNSKKVSRKTVVTRITCTGKGPCAVSVDKPAE